MAIGKMLKIVTVATMLMMLMAMMTVKRAENEMSFEYYCYRFIEFWPEKSLSFLGH